MTPEHSRYADILMMASALLLFVYVLPTNCYLPMKSPIARSFALFFFLVAFAAAAFSGATFFQGIRTKTTAEVRIESLESRVQLLETLKDRFESEKARMERKEEAFNAFMDQAMRILDPKRSKHGRTESTP